MNFASGLATIISTQLAKSLVTHYPYYCAKEKAIDLMNEEQEVLNSLCHSWGISNTEIVDTANRFFNESKRLEKLTEK